MNFRQRASVRLFYLIVALVQLALPGVASVADGLLAASGGPTHAVAHVESHTEKHCIPVHGDDCTFCRYLTSAAADVRPPAPPIPLAAPAIIASPLTLALSEQRALPHALPRAPPIA